MHLNRNAIQRKIERSGVPEEIYNEFLENAKHADFSAASENPAD